MPTETPPDSGGRQWLWFVLIWATGVALFGGVVFVLKAVMARIVGG
ncbi:hypothetical protein DFR24_3562 [Panacagrimonas perspica]|uniref:DUF2474 family protein n=1 Tax=Panacagrimonas perspica TaxID=381431 RepID=A0A4R7NYW0_9GAMM|nr:hypothetical protein [Panacagrimonas perspica]TDU26534.1 hypothetical protein DFR24_3562 [Panacagrimonas perspica]